MSDLQWCEKHDSKMGREVCQEWVGICYRIGRNPFTRIECNPVSALLVPLPLDRETLYGEAFTAYWERESTSRTEAMEHAVDAVLRVLGVTE
jgi:hypothetical protein